MHGQFKKKKKKTDKGVLRARGYVLKFNKGGLGLF